MLQIRKSENFWNQLKIYSLQTNEKSAYEHSKKRKIGQSGMQQHLANFNATQQQLNTPWCHELPAFPLNCK